MPWRLLAAHLGGLSWAVRAAAPSDWVMSGHGFNLRGHRDRASRERRASIEAAKAAELQKKWAAFLNQLRAPDALDVAPALAQAVPEPPDKATFLEELRLRDALAVAPALGITVPPTASG